MFKLFSDLFSGGSSILASIAIYIFVFAGGSASGAFVMHRMDMASYNALVAANQAALTAAVQKAKDVQAATDKIALNAAVAEAQAQQKIVVQHDVLTKEVDTYVPVHVACVTNGIVRLLNAAGIGADPTDASYAPGKPDGACAAISARDLAANIITNYTSGLANAEQLNALEAWVTATVEATR